VLPLVNATGPGATITWAAGPFPGSRACTTTAKLKDAGIEYEAIGCNTIIPDETCWSSNAILRPSRLLASEFISRTRLFFLVGQRRRQSLVGRRLVEQSWSGAANASPKRFRPSGRVGVQDCLQQSVRRRHHVVGLDRSRLPAQWRLLHADCTPKPAYDRLQKLLQAGGERDSCRAATGPKTTPNRNSGTHSAAGVG